MAGWYGVRFMSTARHFSLLQNVQTSSEVHSATYSRRLGSLERSGTTNHRHS